MREEVKVSIVVPVYDCEEYLEACISSILGQTYQNIELLLIDDGSSDGSGRICDAYGDREKVFVYHKENEGVSRARNDGIARSSGDCIMFVDSDDTIEKTMVETLIRALLDTGADCSFCGLVHDYPDHSRNFPERPVYRLTDGEGAIREILMNYIAIAGPVCKLFRRNLLETGDGTGIFPEDLTIGEDAVAVTEALCRAEITVFDTKPLYHYNHREQSLMSSSYSERDWDLIKAYKRIYERLAGHDLAKEAMFRQIWAHFHVYDKMILSGQYDAGGEQEILSWLRHHYKEIMKNPYVGKMRKVSMCMLKINKYLYQRIIRLNHR